MPRISCPKYPDCYIDCPGGGYAYWNDPFGPCVKGCYTAVAGTALLDLFAGSAPDAKYFGTIVDISREALADFAAEFENQFFSVAGIAELKNLYGVPKNELLTISWDDATMAEVIETMANSVKSIEGPVFEA